MPDKDEKQAAHRALVDRVLHGRGTATADQRAAAFHNTDVPPPLRTLIDKVVTKPTQLTDADFAAAESAGFSEDQLFEVVVSAAVGRSARLYDAGLAALATAIGEVG
ncbi:hypothetical protein ACFWF7_31860 [Nocardia sp. NPDC060256]|uniref:hypothetical protein n=1 Tax=unclassified Nocardia TaxID=2637762 RepID=UPI0036565357